MIQYKIESMSKTQRMMATEQRNKVFKPMLRGLKCNTCKQPSQITWAIVDGKYLKDTIDACCDTFESQMNTALGR